MLTVDELIFIPYRPEFTQAGLEHLCRCLAYERGTLAGSASNDRMRHTVAQTAAELAFHRTLTQQEVPYHVAQTAPYADPNRIDLNLGGRRCHLINTLITSKAHIRELRRDPEALLHAYVVSRYQEFNISCAQENDLLVFGITTALIASSRSDLDRARAAGEPTFLMHVFPINWRNRNQLLFEKSTQPVILKSESATTLLLELGGLSSKSSYKSEHISLPPLLRVEAREEFATLVYAHVDRHPDGKIAINDANRAQTHIIRPERWQNFWLYGIEVILIGYMTAEQFKRRSRMIPRGKGMITYGTSSGKNPYLAVTQLRPLADLFSRVKNWAANSTKFYPSR